MASPTRTLTVNIVGRTDSVDKAFKRVSKGSSLMSDRLAKGLKMGGLAFAALGGAAVAAARTLGPMIQKAADIEESLSKNKVLFGEASVAVEKWSERTTKSLGISRREALEAVGNFGALTHAMGMSGEEGSKMSMRLVDLAADMASFNNASPEETLTAIAAGLRGENEPLRRFGVLLDAATLKQRAFEKGLIDSTKEALTPQTKALAAYSEILAQTEVQQGDFQRTSDGLANQQKLLSATWDDLQASIGEKLRPALLGIVTAINENVLPAFEALVDDPSVETLGEELGKIFYNAIGEGMSKAEKEEKDDDGFFSFLTEPSFTVKAITGGVSMGMDLLKGIKRGFGERAREADLLAEVERIMDEKAAIFGQDFADAWFNAFNQRMGGFDFEIPDLEDKTFEELNPQGAADKVRDDAAFFEAMGFDPPTTGLTSQDPLETATGMPIIPGLDPSTGMPLITPAEMAALNAFLTGSGAISAEQAQGPGARGKSPIIGDPRAAAFQSAVAAGAAHVTVNINAPAVTSNEVQEALVKGFTDDSIGISDIYFI